MGKVTFNMSMSLDGFIAARTVRLIGSLGGTSAATPIFSFRARRWLSRSRVPAPSIFRKVAER